MATITLEPESSSVANESLPLFARTFLQKLASYLAPHQIKRVEQAFLLGAFAHGEQTRKSGEPYITHPVAVADILADMRMDVETLCAAILHDTLEDTKISRIDLEQQFGTEVAALVDGVTKLDRVKFQTRQEANAESFRKMMLAMANDLRVIMIKLADRMHNMRTLDSMSDEARRRIALETLEIYAPIAQRFGMNLFKAELQNLGFAALYPLRYRTLKARLDQIHQDRSERFGGIQTKLSAKLQLEDIPHRMVARVKAPYSVYMKMRRENKPLSEVTDMYGIRLVVPDVMECYMALGISHSLYTPMDARFKDFIAVPKPNGYQSLHTVLFGPMGNPIELQIRTEDMDVVAERGVAAHWSYKASGPSTNAQDRARQWLQNFLESQERSDSSLEFVENVKIDLFPDEVYLFTPKGDILSLPRNATALDFAYAVHTSVGDHAVTARVDKKLVPLRTVLQSGQNVEIITTASAQPNSNWLDYVVTSKARTAIRHHMKKLHHEDAISIGHRMLDKALDAVNASLDNIPAKVIDDFLAENRLRRLEDLLSDIALGNRMPNVVALQLIKDQNALELGSNRIKHEKIMITGNERGVISFGNCCHPLPGDEIMGFLSAGKGIVVHRADCRNVHEMSKSIERIVAIDWDREVKGDFKVNLRAVVDNKPGVLATVAAAIAESNSNIEHVEYLERDLTSAVILFTIQVSNRTHLADVIRRMRRANVVHQVTRDST